MQRRRERDEPHQHDEADDDDLGRQVLLGARQVGGGDFLGLARESGEAGLDAVPDGGKGLHHADEAAGRDGARADVEHIRAADVVGRHVGDGHRARRERPGERFAEKLDQRDQHEIREHAARGHDRRDAEADDVADAEQLGRNLHADRAALERSAEDFFGDFFPELERGVGRLVEQAEREAREDDVRTRRLAEPGRLGGAHLLLSGRRGSGAVARVGAGFQHRRARRALGEFQDAVVLHDMRPPQRDHHQDAEDRAEQADEQHACQLEVEAEDENRGHRHAHAERDGLTRRAGRLRDVVFENRRVAPADLRPGAEQRQRNHGDRDRRADGQADLEHEVERRRAEHHTEDGAGDDGAQGKFPQEGAGGDVGFEFRGSHESGGGVTKS